MDQIIIEGLEVSTIIGVYDWERLKPQSLIIDVVMETDLRSACESDDVTDTIDYAVIAELISVVAKRSEFKLLEALGNAIIEEILANFLICDIALTITKPGILPNARNVAVRLNRKGACFD